MKATNIQDNVKKGTSETPESKDPSVGEGVTHYTVVEKAVERFVVNESADVEETVQAIIGRSEVAAVVPVFVICIVQVYGHFVNLLHTDKFFHFQIMV